jgi:hypothetical protein
MPVPAFDKILNGQNFRPLVMPIGQIRDIVQNPRFHKMGFYATKLRSQGLVRGVVTLRYMLFDEANTPYEFDFINPTSLPSSNRLKTGPNVFATHPEGHNSFVLTKEELERIKSMEADFVLFFLEDKSVNDLKSFSLRYITLKLNQISGGGGPLGSSQTPAP